MGSDTLLLHAAALEVDGLTLPRGLVRSTRIGVGKAAAAASTMRALLERRPDQVLLVGVCGAFPAEHLAVGEAMAVGDVCLVGESLLADEGVATEQGFVPLASLREGLADHGPFAADGERTARAAAALAGAPIVRCATVSTCSGAFDRSRLVAARTGAQVETMESAAVALTCGQLDVPFVELRSVSNRTGDRASAGWDLDSAVERLHTAILDVVESGALEEAAA